ncbi:glyoxalase [Peribacillus simplex]|uniref:glyoxalase/bleomycin resistance/dioxygenase family protein n=1 Tax=Peribacillus simplex TaxID=1478 RepID=UPI00077771ED|nr:glyoxalase/bleomycin resistance/dioxygenase family protein [Peribacillus simplex]AMM94760.1 glyoxalase [Peribacillus simplex]
MIINKVTLYSHALNDMRKFYVNELGFELLSHTDDGFEIRAGDSVLEIKKYHLQKKPFYHFAMNIPTDLFTLAKAWANSKVELTSEDDEDEVYFSYSDAHAFYFSDPSGNIVEFISRYSVSPKSGAESFSAQNVLCISEMNITTNEVRALGNQLISFGIPVRSGEPIREDGLNFMGEHEAGAFLLLGPRKRRWFFSDRESEIFPLSLVIDQQIDISLDGEGLMELKKMKLTKGED